MHVYIGAHDRTVATVHVQHVVGSLHVPGDRNPYAELQYRTYEYEYLQI